MPARKTLDTRRMASALPIAGPHIPREGGKEGGREGGREGERGTYVAIEASGPAARIEEMSVVL